MLLNRKCYSTWKIVLLNLLLLLRAICFILCTTRFEGTLEVFLLVWVLFSSHLTFDYKFRLYLQKLFNIYYGLLHFLHCHVVKYLTHYGSLTTWSLEKILSNFDRIKAMTVNSNEIKVHKKFIKKVSRIKVILWKLHICTIKYSILKIVIFTSNLINY